MASVRNVLLLTLAGGAAFAATKTPIFTPAPAPAATNAPAFSAPSAFHCQVPCGIYGDHMRIEMILEDCATIEKGMTSITAIESGEDPNPSINQAVRWVSNKESHAQAIQDQVAQYWLAQRIKAPKDGADAAAAATYAQQLALMHQITVSAMKCKQTTDVAHVNKIRETVRAFAGTYFSADDLEHLKSHIGGGHDHDHGHGDGHDHDHDGDGHGHDHDGGDHSHEGGDHDHGDGGR